MRRQDAWSLESAIKLQNLILMMISGGVKHLLCATDREPGSERAGTTQVTAGPQCHGPDARTPSAPSTERTPSVLRGAHIFPRLPEHRWPAWEQEGRLLHCFRCSQTLAHPGWGAAEGLKREAPGGRRASTGLGRGPGRCFPPVSWTSGHVSTSLRWPRQRRTRRHELGGTLGAPVRRVAQSRAQLQLRVSMAASSTLRLRGVWGG